MEILAPADEEVLTREALDLVARLHRELNPRRRSCSSGGTSGSSTSTRARCRTSCRRRRTSATPSGGSPRPRPTSTTAACEITGPVDRKMMINALNSGARVFMADFEDACSPTWENVVDGQRERARRRAPRRSRSTTAGARRYRLNDEIATLVDPAARLAPATSGTSLVDGEPVSAASSTSACAFFHNARELLERGSGPYFYLPKLETHLEARLWNDVFALAEEELGIPRGTIRAHRPDRDDPRRVRDGGDPLRAARARGARSTPAAGTTSSARSRSSARATGCCPTASQVTMTVPFMRAYTELLVRTCHRRGAHAIGGMAAFIPSRATPR